ncbi:MAG: hypothetical protein [Bacteriophage sp.]|nr:MAG: hypothetical protein [Bacteriophage sp.]
MVINSMYQQCDALEVKCKDSKNSKSFKLKIIKHTKNYFYTNEVFSLGLVSANKTDRSKKVIRWNKETLTIYDGPKCNSFKVLNLLKDVKEVDECL